MAHRSGNATWQDTPSTATLVSAARLEAIEAAIDASQVALNSGPMIVQKNTSTGGSSEFFCAVAPTGAVVSNYGLAVASSLYGHIVGVPRTLTLVKEQVEINTAGAAGATMRVGMWNVNSDGWPTTIIWDSGSFLVDTTGTKAFTSSLTIPAGAVFVGATTSDVNVRYRGFQHFDRAGFQGGYGTNLTNRGHLVGTSGAYLTSSALPTDLSALSMASANGATQGVPMVVVSISAVS